MVTLAVLIVFVLYLRRMDEADTVRVGVGVFIVTGLIDSATTVLVTMLLCGWQPWA